MLKCSISLLLIFACPLVFGQTQNGYVKTKGTDNKKGLRLDSVIIKPSIGNEVRSLNGGKFGRVCGKRSFSITKVMKQGYILTDKDFPLQTFSYSTNDIVIVIERASDRIRQKNEIVRRLSVSNEDAFVKNNAEIERLKAEGSKTQKELARLRALYKKEHENNRKLIDQMAEKLVSIDYDNLDRLNSQVTELISKGMIEDAKKLLASADNDYVNDISKKNKSLAATYYNRFIINSLDNKYDDAADNIVKRADLDLHNIGWQLDAGVFFMKRHQGQKAIDILRRAIEKNKKRDNCDNNAQIAMVYNNLGLLYLEQKHHEKAEKCFNKALTIFEKYAEDNPEYYKPLIAALQSNLGIIYSDNYFEKSETKTKCSNYCL